MSSMISWSNNSNKYSIDVPDSFCALRSKEIFYRPNDYFSKIRKSSRSSLHEGVKFADEKCRYAMANWCIKILNFCQTSKDLAIVAMNTLDRFLSTEQGQFAAMDRRWFQLAVMCSLQISIKMYESNKLDVHTLFQLSQGEFTEHEIISMEQEIIFALGWRFAPPTAYEFLEMYMTLTTSKYLSEEMKRHLLIAAKTQIDWTVSNYSFITKRPSEVALASILNAMDKIDSFPRAARGDFLFKVSNATDVDFRSHEIQSICLMLHKLHVRKMEKIASASRYDDVTPPSASKRQARKDPNSPVSVRDTI